MLLVGVMTIRDEHFAAHIGKVDVLRPFAAAAVEKEGFVFPNVLVSDYSTGKTRRGSGTAFLNAAAKFARDNGKGTLFVDCFANSTGKLVEYVERPFPVARDGLTLCQILRK